MNVVVVELKAARLKGLPRFHVLDMVGMPLCLRAWTEPLVPVEHDQMLGAAFVPDSLRCHRFGCIDAWPGQALA